jgi:hypothetical protein
MTDIYLKDGTAWTEMDLEDLRSEIPTWPLDRGSCGVSLRGRQR